MGRLQSSSRKEALVQDKINRMAELFLEQFGRMPTVNEIFYFIHGTDAEREHIWNHGIPEEEEEMWAMAHEQKTA